MEKDMSIPRHLPALSGLLALGLGLAGCVAAPPPSPCPAVPPLPIEVMPKPPVSATPLVWQPGQWIWTGNAYAYQQGVWAPRLGGSTTWMPGFWTMAPGGACHWNSAHFL
jgi:hypothetical protein